MTLTGEQQRAFEAIVDSHENIFLTGGAGTGKSFVLEKVLNYLSKKDKNIRICAPTGVAAINIGGTTIHRLLELVPSKNIIGEIPNSIPDKLKDVRRVIVDEISMCRSDLFSWLFNCIRLEEIRQQRPIQLVVVGDFCQLPPVIPEREKSFFKNKSKFAFATKEWQDCRFTTIVLNQVVRQKDSQFSKALNQLRIGAISEINYFNKNAVRQKNLNAICICSTNKKVDQINQKYLNQAKARGTKFRKFYSTETGSIGKEDRPSPQVIELWKGARIICTANGNGFSNGLMGTVQGFVSTETGLSIVVELDGQVENKTIIQPYTWGVYDYVTKVTINKNGNKCKKLVKEQIGSYTQLPVRIGYAITVHRSQGKTYDKAIVYPDGWTSGLLYVALSRVKSIENLEITEYLTPNMVCLDYKVKEFYNEITEKKMNVPTIKINMPVICISDLKKIMKMNALQIKEFQQLVHNFVKKIES